MNEINIFYTCIKEISLESLSIQTLENQLPWDYVKCCQKYENHNMYKVSLISKLLLFKGINILSNHSFDLKNCPRITIGQNGKVLFRKEEFQFSISHNSDYIICSLTTNSLVGVDVESKDKKIDSKLFDKLMRPLNESQSFDWINGNKGADFLKKWVVLESVLKADGMSLSPEKTNINIFDEYVIDYNEKKWYYDVSELEHNNLLGYVSNEKIDNVRFYQMNKMIFNKL